MRTHGRHRTREHVEPGHRTPRKVFGAWEYAFYDSFRATGLFTSRPLKPV
ncbi:hypothetical protein ABZ595_14655 [Streptomyces rubradiris]